MDKTLGLNHGLKIKRWLRALALAKLLFEEEGYFTTYLEEIEENIRVTNGMEQINRAVQRSKNKEF